MANTAPVPRTVLVFNPHDDVALTRRLDALAGPGRLIVRPTPGGTGTDLARDLLAALGKSPEALQEDRLSTANTWRTGAGWAKGAGVTDLVVDRAHRLPARHVEPLLDLARTIGATLWLIWSGPQPTATLVSRLKEAADGAQMIDAPTFYQRLPLPPAAARLPANPDAGTPWPVVQWPRLPLADFPLFLATCRRTLPGDTFAALSFLYRKEMHATARWPGDKIGDLTAYLRDQRLGPAPSPEDALIRLRAIQSALFLSGILLRWQPATLGPDPAARLLTQFPERTGHALRAGAATEAAAATALALYFGGGPSGFDMILCRHIAPDGSTFHLPLPADRDRVSIRAPWSGRRDHENYVGTAESDYLRTHDPVPMPQHAKAVLAAHLAYRQAEGAGPDDPYFIHRREPGTLSPVPGLREAIMRTCHRLNLDAPWLHRSHCRHGDDLGRTTGDWLAHRGLTVDHANPDLRARL